MQRKTLIITVAAVAIIVLAAVLLASRDKAPRTPSVPTDQTAPSMTPDKSMPEASSTSSTTPDKQQPQPTHIANPASQYYEQQGGTVKIEKLGSGDEVGICVFADNRQCEEWAMYNKFCPVGGVAVAGYATPESKYCATLGGTYHDEGKGHCTFGTGAECYIEDLWNAACHLHFNEPATGYKYEKYKGPNALIGYPERDVKLVDKINSSHEEPQLTVEVTKIADMPSQGPLNYDQETSRKDEAALAKGEFGEEVDTPVKISEKVVKIYPHLYAKEFVVLQRADVCDVTFQRIAIFYSNHYQVKVTLTGNKKEIMEENPSYFEEDKKNCGEHEKAWAKKDEHTVHEDFVKALQEGKLTGQNTDNWYNVFDVMVDGMGVVN